MLLVQLTRTFPACRLFFTRTTVGKLPLQEFTLDIFLETPLVVELDVAAAFTVWTVKGEILSLISPRHMVAENGHRSDKFIFAAAELHRLVDIICQLLFPALAFHSSAVLSGGYSITAALVWLENGKSVCNADFVAELA